MKKKRTTGKKSDVEKKKLFQESNYVIKRNGSFMKLFEGYRDDGLVKYFPN